MSVVVNSFSSGIGGGGFLLLRKKVDGQDLFDMFDFRETAPENVSIEDLQRHQDASKIGGTAVCTPGEVMGLYEAHKQYGRLPWARLFEENIAIARGFRASRILIVKLHNNKERVLGDEGLSAVFARNGVLVEEGDTVVRENYARTLEKIAQDPMSFYREELADKIVASIQRNGGSVTGQNMAEYRAKKRDVIEGQYLDFKVYTTSLPTSGVLVLEALKILEHIDFDKLKTVDREDRMYIFYHMLIETFKFISAKRGELGDPDFLESYKLIISNLVSNKHTRSDIFQKIKTTNTLEHNDYEQAVPFVEDHGTTHLNVVDQDGTIVQITSTINLEFGANFMDPETGIIFNNQIDDFFIPQVENSYNLPPMIGNLIQKKKRPFSSISPIFCYL
ncbi:uncharacterized protein [Maniola hyperantus]|uniref:uncharacterized protein n=1 Tax=Aphantopus hyperantus TaxID=2795564 RepID=UPI00156938DB|nr:glutathione hydrolase proenzyme 2-like [Maniola hyperantus]